LYLLATNTHTHTYIHIHMHACIHAYTHTYTCMHACIHAYTHIQVQGEVDVLMENAKLMAVEVEQKVAGANTFAEQVGVEKEKVNAENGGCPELRMI